MGEKKDETMRLTHPPVLDLDFKKSQLQDESPTTDYPPLIFTNNTQNSPLIRQSLAAFGPIAATMGAGMVMGYSATLLPELQQEDSDIPINQEVGSWIASLVLLPMSFGCLLGGGLIEKLGRKRTHMILSIPLLLGWIFVYFAKNLEMLLIGRVFGGLSVGLMGPACSVYLSEMSDPKYRGLFLGTLPMALSIGILVVHVVGTFLSWRATALFSCTCPALCYLMITLVPESPSWLISKDRYNEAAKAFKWLRGSGVQQESEFKEMLERRKMTKMNGEALPFWIQLKLNIRKPEFMKPFMIVFICFVTMQLTGPNTVTFYSVNMMKETLGAGMNEYAAMIFIDILRAFMSVIACILLRICNRRFLTIVSGIGTTVSLFALSIFILSARYYPELNQYSWLSILFLVTYIIFISIGIFPMPWCMAGELLPVALRSFGTSINTMFNFFWCFLVVKMAPGMFVSVGMDGTFFSYGLVCLIGTLLLYCFMPETKNKTLAQIEARFAQNTRTRTENV